MSGTWASEGEAVGAVAACPSAWQTEALYGNFGGKATRAQLGLGKPETQRTAERQLRIGTDGMNMLAWDEAPPALLQRHIQMHSFSTERLEMRLENFRAKKKGVTIFTVTP